MERIYPLTDEHLQHIIGMPVCAVMKNGYRYVGIAESCRSGRLALADPASRYRHGYYGGQAGSLSPQAHDQGKTNEQNEQLIKKTESGAVNNSVRGKKRYRKGKASASAKDGVSTHSSENGQNPSISSEDGADINAGILKLDDIHLLFLII